MDNGPCGWVSGTAASNAASNASAQQRTAAAGRGRSPCRQPLLEAAEPAKHCGEGDGSGEQQRRDRWSGACSDGQTPVKVRRREEGPRVAGCPPGRRLPPLTAADDGTRTSSVMRFLLGRAQCRLPPGRCPPAARPPRAADERPPCRRPGCVPAGRGRWRPAPGSSRRRRARGRGPTACASTTAPCGRPDGAAGPVTTAPASTTRAAAAVTVGWSQNQGYVTPHPAGRARPPGPGGSSRRASRAAAAPRCSCADTCV